MMRWESKDGESAIRYDGYETLVHVVAWRKGHGLSVHELDELIRVLTKARAARKDVEPEGAGRGNGGG